MGSRLGVIGVATAIASCLNIAVAAQRQVPPPRPNFPKPPVPLLPDPIPNRPQLEQQAAMLKQRIVCGMTLIPAPQVDPNMPKKQEPRPKAPTKYTIHPMQPSICWD